MFLSKKIVAQVVLLLGIIIFVSLIATSAKEFEVPRIVIIEDGFTMADAARLLAENDVVYSYKVVRLISRIRGADTLVKAGEYLFVESISAWEAVARLTEGDYGFEPVRVRIPEGVTRRQIADILVNSLNDFDREKFLDLTHDKEGYLFPDTYFFSPNMSEENVVEELESTFFKKTNRLKPRIILSGRSLEEIVIVASLIEREAHIPEDQRLISGVLWNRLEIGMALQVDAPFFFLLGKTSSELTQEDLKIDSPYNLYINTGLPPTPIANPGLGAVEAALSPTSSEYLFYLSDSDGVTHYAEDFEEHKKNKELYLR